MKIKTIFILLYMLISFISLKAQNEVAELVIYKSFWRGGTTTTISKIFNEPVKYSIDTTNINIGEINFFKEFEKILSKSKQKKHFQQKIAGIEIAGEFRINSSSKHFFIVCKPNLLIDISNKKEYEIADELLLKQMFNWINTLKCNR